MTEKQICLRHLIETLKRCDPKNDFSANIFGVYDEQLALVFGFSFSQELARRYLHT